jgi:hypothetical protein
MSTLQSQFSGAAASISLDFAGSSAALPRGTTILGSLDLQQYDRYTIYVTAIEGALTGVKVWSSPDGVNGWVQDTAAIGAMATGDVAFLSLSRKSYKYVQVGAYHALGGKLSAWISVGGLS